MAHDHGKAAIIPTLRYRDAPAAIDFLCNAFGFERHLVVPGAEGIVEHAQLALAGAMIMLGSVRDNPWQQRMREPRQAGGPTSGLYVLVEEVDAHCARARAAGAEIVSAPADQSYGGRNYTARDPEGYIWDFGSYDPWAS
jgi:uncharacterized glyoxalase superfamily protein PhnB